MIENSVIKELNKFRGEGRALLNFAEFELVWLSSFSVKMKMNHKQRKKSNHVKDLFLHERTKNFHFSCQKQSPKGIMQTAALENHANFTGKHLCFGGFLIKLQDIFNKVAG